MGLLLAHYWRTILILVALLSLVGGEECSKSIIVPLYDLPEDAAKIENYIDLTVGAIPPIPDISNATALHEWLILVMAEPPPSPRAAEFRARIDRILHNDTG